MCWCENLLMWKFCRKTFPQDGRSLYIDLISMLFWTAARQRNLSARVCARHKERYKLSEIQRRFTQTQNYTEPGVLITIFSKGLKKFSDFDKIIILRKSKIW